MVVFGIMKFIKSLEKDTGFGKFYFIELAHKRNTHAQSRIYPILPQKYDFQTLEKTFL